MELFDGGGKMLFEELQVDITDSSDVEFLDIVNGYWATRGGEGDSDVPLQFDAQQDGVQWNGMWDGEEVLLVTDDDTATTDNTLRSFAIEPENDPKYGVQPPKIV